MVNVNQSNLQCYFFTFCINTIGVFLLKSSENGDYFTCFQAKTKGGGPTGQPGAAAAAPVAQAAAVAPSAGAANGGQPDYSAQWAEYYRSLGKIKEAEAIEAQMKTKVRILPVYLSLM